VSSLLHGIVHVILDNSCGPWAPIKKHEVGPDVNMDLTVGQTMLHVEPPTVLKNLLSIASLHEGVPQQNGEAMMVQTPRAQAAILVGTVRVVYHLREDFKILEFSKIDNPTQQLLEKINKEEIRI
jgi:hypothetical protein